jgi:hypothetical protein
MFQTRRGVGGLREVVDLYIKKNIDTEIRVLCRNLSRNSYVEIDTKSESEFWENQYIEISTKLG